VPSKRSRGGRGDAGGLDGALDVIVPRGGKSLVARVQAEARVPVFAHLEGNNHVYVHAGRISPWRGTSCSMPRCGAPGSAAPPRRCWLIGRLPPKALKPLVSALLDAGCAVRGDAETAAVDARVTAAGREDWATEYLDAIIAVKVVDGI
jgi:glutamate-5-semialdehyde dehydrogenase